MRPAFDHGALIQHQDLIAVPDRGQPVGDHDAGDAPVLDGLYQLVLGQGVQGGGGLVQDDQGGVLGQDPGDLQTLPLSAGQISS